MSSRQSPQLVNQIPDNRFFPRWSVSNKVLCRVSGHVEGLQALSQDISCSGICVETYEHIYPAQKLKLIIYLDESEILTLNGKVIWVQEYAQKRRAGIAFDDIDISKQEKVLQHAFEVRKKDVVDHWFQGWDGNHSG